MKSRSRSDPGLCGGTGPVENESGAKLGTAGTVPRAQRCLGRRHPVKEQVDRLSRLTASDWEALKAKLAEKHIRVVALDLPTSWMMAATRAAASHCSYAQLGAADCPILSNRGTDCRFFPLLFQTVALRGSLRSACSQRKIQ